MRRARPDRRFFRRPCCAYCGVQEPWDADTDFCEDCQPSDCTWCGTTYNRPDLDEDLRCRTCACQEWGQPSQGQATSDGYLSCVISFGGYTTTVWEVEFTDEFAQWWAELSVPQQEAINTAVEHLQATGPGLGRPWVDTVKGSRHANMKELRPRGGHLRILFAFDPRRSAILLLGGDKTGRWHSWYAQAILQADQMYDDHLEALRREGELP